MCGVVREGWRRRRRKRGTRTRRTRTWMRKRTKQKGGKKGNRQTAMLREGRMGSRRGEMDEWENNEVEEEYKNNDSENSRGKE